jgi:hypothetical protein
VTGNSAQERLDGIDVVEEATELLRCLPYGLLDLVASLSTKVSSGALNRMM